jgi:hypothetical protein
MGKIMTLTPVKRTTPSFWRGKRAILVGFLAAGSVAAYFLAPVPGAITGLQITGLEGKAMTNKMGNGTAPRSVPIPPIDASLPGVTETATFALG